MAVRSRSLAAFIGLAPATWTNVYTVPGGRTAIVKYVSVANASGAARQVLLRVRSATASPQVQRWSSVPAGEAVSLSSVELTLNPGEALEIWVGNETSNTQIHVFASGALLQGSPE